MLDLATLKKQLSQALSWVMKLPSMIMSNVGFNRNTLLGVILLVILYVAYRHHFVSDLTGDVMSGVDTVMDTVGLSSHETTGDEPVGYEPEFHMTVA